MKQHLIKISGEDVIGAFSMGFRLGRRRHKRHCGYFDYSVEVTPKGQESMPLQLSITNEQQVTVHLSPKTPRGKDAVLDGIPEWSIISGNCTVVPAEDGLSATIVSGDDLGVSEVSVKADAELGEGIEEIADFIEVSVGGARATSLGLSADAPVTKPE